MLTLPRSLSLTPDQFAEVCAANPEAVLELDDAGTLIEMTPTGGSTSIRNTRLLMRLQLWADRQGDWKVFDSSGGFLLPDGSVRRPDASLVRLERWQALSEAERDGFPPLCPDLVVELGSEPWVMPPSWRRLRSFLA
jgi:Uma2 family endonuclease